MTFPPSEVIEVVNRIAEILRERNATLAVSEAACGGLISAYLVSVPGALDFYIGGKLVYALKQRLRVLGWLDQEISRYVGPSEQVVLKLARNAKYELGSTYVLSESGFAGPSANLHLNNAEGVERDETNDVSQVGIVYLGFSGPEGDVSCTMKTNLTDRAYNMGRFAQWGLEFLLAEIGKED